MGVEERRVAGSPKIQAHGGEQYAASVTGATDFVFFPLCGGLVHIS